MRTYAVIVAVLTGLAPVDVADLYQPDPPLPITRIDTISLEDSQRDKKLALRVTLPADAKRYPVVIFSHGATGSKDGYQPLATYWAARGYVVIQPTHLDSRQLGGRIADRSSLARAWKDRCDDVTFIINALSEIEKRLPGEEPRMDHAKIAVAGHSYGAITSQMIAGMAYILPRGQRIAFADSRPVCFVLISPQGTGPALTAESYRDMTRPMLMITGDNDGTPLGDGKGPWRREAFEHSPTGSAWLMWIKNANHSFQGIAGPVRRNYPDQVQWIQSTSTAFLDAQLKADADAAKWIADDELRQATDGKAWLETKAKVPAENAD